jgi:hypothetical protein
MACFSHLTACTSTVRLPQHRHICDCTQLLRVRHVREQRQHRVSPPVSVATELMRTRKRRNTRGECVARAPLDTPTADQHTRAAPNCYVQPVGEHWPWCVCIPCTAAIAQQCLMQRAGIHCWCRQVALCHRSTRDRLSDSSLPAPLYISVLAGHGLCLSHTHTVTHCSCVCLGGFLHPALFFFR